MMKTRTPKLDFLARFARLKIPETAKVFCVEFIKHKSQNTLGVSGIIAKKSNKLNSRHSGKN